MSTSLTSLRSSLERVLGDLAIYVSNETIGIGNASKTVFYFAYPPIVASSESVYLDDVVQASGFTVDDDYGKVTFTSAPGSAVKVSVDYKGRAYHTGDLDNIITEATEELVLLYPDEEFTIDGSDNVDPDPDQDEKRLIILQSKVNFISGLLGRWSTEAIRTARTGYSMDTTKRVDGLSKLLDIETVALEKAVDRTIHNRARALDYDMKA